MKLTSGINIIKKSIDIYFKKENLLFLLKVYFFAFLVGLIFYIPQKFYQGMDFNEFIKKPFIGPGIGISALVYIFLDFLTRIAGYEAVRRVIAKEKFDIRATFSKALRLLPRFFAVSILVGLAVGVGFVLLIIPGIIFATWFSMSMFVLVNENIGIIESMKRSKALVKGKFWPVAGKLAIFMLFTIVGNIIFSFLPFGLGATAVTIFGGLFILPGFLLYKELKTI
jgi:hypothetical protein